MQLTLIFTLFCGYDLEKADKIAELLNKERYYPSIISSVDYRSEGKVIDSRIEVKYNIFKDLEDIESFDEYKRIVSETNEKFNIFYRKLIKENDIAVSGEYTYRVEFYDVSFPGTCKRYKD